MTLSTSLLTDPTLRSQLQSVYETRKTTAIEAWEERPDQPAEAQMTMPDGTVETLTAIPFTAQQLERAFVDFDTWLDTMVQTGESSDASLATAMDRVAEVEAMNPANSAKIAATFSQDGVLLAYIREDGTLATSNGSEDLLAGISEEAETSGLSGEMLVDYLKTKVTERLADAYPYLDVESFDSETSPTIGEFANSWSAGFDADAVYEEALSDAQVRLDEARAWADRWQANLYEIQGLLMQAQSA
jgi:hypothetical protein